MIERIWSDLLRFIETLVSPDWGALIALVPLILFGLVVLYVVWIVVRFRRAGPPRRVRRRRVSPTPAGIHMPGPSYAPIIAAVGVFFLFAGLVFGGVSLAIGGVILALSLLYWGREALRDYDRDVAGRHVELAPGPVESGPPPGIHMPGPSFRPILISIALAILFYGLVFGGLLLLVGFVVLAIALVGWLNDAGKEYRDTLVLDATGHMPSHAKPRYPRGIIAVFVILVVGGIVLQTGLLPPRSAVGTPGASAPAGSPGPGGSEPPGSPGPGPGVPADATVAAANIAFDTDSLTVPAGRPFRLHFVNDDAGIPHNVAIHTESPTGPAVFTGEIFPGVADRVYEVPALQAGAYAFVCTVHPNMTGTLTAR